MVWCFIQLSQTLANTHKKIYMMKPMKLYERSEVDKTSLTSLTHTHTHSHLDGVMIENGE